MNLIFIYGPPAAGKLTVSNEIAKLTGYRVFHNHTLVGSVASAFPFGDKSSRPIRNRLSRKFRIEIFEEAAKNNVDLVTTYGGSGDDKFEFFEEVKTSVEKNGGKVLFVLLCPSVETVLKRVESKSRKSVKIDNQDFLKSKFDKPNDYYGKFKNIEHVSIDNSELKPIEAAKEIIRYYKL
jgi:shikimate kinase